MSWVIFFGKVICRCIFERVIYKVYNFFKVSVYNYLELWFKVDKNVILVDFTDYIWWFIFRELCWEFLIRESSKDRFFFLYFYKLEFVSVKVCVLFFCL